MWNQNKAALSLGTFIYCFSAVAPAAKSIEVDPYPGDGKCYFIENETEIDYREGTESLAILSANPWFGDQAVSKLAAEKFWENSKPKQNWRFAYNATAGNTKGTNNDQLNAWYYTRDEHQEGFAGGSQEIWNFATGFEYACVGETPGDGAFDNLNLPGIINK